MVPAPESDKILELDNVMQKSNRSPPERSRNEDSESRGTVPCQGEKTIQLYPLSSHFAIS